MKCAYEFVQEKNAQKEAHEKLEDLCYDLGMKFLAYVEALTENVAAEQLGVGRRKMKQMREETQEDLNHYMCMYAETDREGNITGELWETTQDTAAGLLPRLKRLGVDMKSLSKAFKVPDTFGQTWHTERENELHQWKVNYIDNMETKLSVYWAVIMLWFHDSEGFGAIKLTRYYTAIRERYNVFASTYLNGKRAWSKELDRMIEEEQDILKMRGIETQNIPVKKTEKNVPIIPESKEFIEKAIKLFDNLRSTHRF